jgi:hypothetical protein
MASAVPFSNLYTKKTATAESSCWVCGKLTQLVLTHNDIDWFFTCVGHLRDASFCKPVPLPPPPKVPEKDVTPPSPKKLKSETEEGGTDAETKPKQDKKEEKKPKKPVKKPEPVAAPPPLPADQHKQFILDAKLFYMRQSQYRNKLQAKAARQVSQQLPSVPRSFK